MTITLYANCKLTQDKNFAVDDISDYLDTFSTADVLTETDLNYFKHKRETFILLDLGQSALNYYNKRFNFCKIQNGTDKAVYYFITNLEWRSKQVIYLTLYQDTVSTFGILPLTDKTLVHREHKDRFTRISATKAEPIIDKVSEGLQPIMLKDKEQIVSYDGTDNAIDLYNTRWYVAYINNDDIVATDYNQSNPVTMWIFAENKIAVAYGVSTNHNITLGEGELSFAPIPLKNGTGNQYVNYQIKIENNTIDIESHYDLYGGLVVNWVKIKRLAGDLIYTKCKTIYNSAMAVTSSSSEPSVTIAANEYYGRECPAYIYIYKCNSLDIYNAGTYYTARYFGGGSECNGLVDLDRTNSKIIKIIELPYCPLNIRGLINDGLHFYNNVEIANTPISNFKALRFREGGNLKEELKCQLSYSAINPFPSNYKRYNPSNLSRTALKNKDYEFKLLHSEIYNFKFTYDSFSKLVKLENITFNDDVSANIMKFAFVPSMNISSKFLFDLEATFQSDIEEDYGNILAVNRNNETPIYTSQYINYLRTGYNYDVKAKEQKNIQNIVGGALGLVGSAVGVAAGIASENPFLIGASIAGAVTSVTSMTANTIYNSISMEQSIEQKLAQAKAQANSVQTADDLSLLDYYTKNNKAKLCYYKPSEAMENNIYNLFYYLGYRSEQMKKPSLDSRLRFNFIQADIDIDFNKVETNTMNMTKEIIDDYKGRFAVGLTLFHYFNSEYDFEQKYENWESVFENDLTA